MNRNKKTWLLAGTTLLLAALVAALLLAGANRDKQQAQEGAKAVTIRIENADGGWDDHVLHTDAGTLEAALTEAGLMQGETGEYGFFITHMDGRFADSAKGEWWVFTKGNEWIMTGVSETVIADGDSYEFSVYKG